MLMVHEEVKDHQSKKHMLIILALLTTDVICNSCSLQMPIKRVASVNSWFHLSKILISSLLLNLFDDEHIKMQK